MSRATRAESVGLVLGILTVVLSVLAAYEAGNFPGWGSGAALALLLVFGVTIAVGEWFQISAPGLRGSAPLATASAFGLCFTVEVPDGGYIAYAAAVVIAVTSVATAIGVGARLAARHAVSFIEVSGRLAAVVVVALLYRNVYLGQSTGAAVIDHWQPPWQNAVTMLAIAAVGLLADVALTSALRALAAGGGLRRIVLEELVSSVTLSSPVAVTGVLIALAAPTLGIAALPLFLVPLVLTLFAFRRYVSIRATYLQSIRTLSRLTDAAGYTPAGHSERVAALALRVGRELALPERELLDLEYAALLHDIGQVALVEPIPGGATVLAAPADQRRIEADTVAIVRETGVLEGVARILEHQTTPYRQVRELGEEIPLTSRIIKVVNAYEDLNRGARGSRSRDAALERIYLGLGYEYDPRVVDALLRVLDVAPHHADAAT
ncbi:HD-GYP domain-containing protein [Humibacillus xanthopallidus]|uniref:HD domain-containing protein n=1 Tax=Humibacillus xanthopallidus TaxID=412689 RepID=A0A543HVI4_9MICO|nr:HD domain-containing phosphohydrolase [Humibacillus xanthopallidus]TQM62312.1 HD domain-containing protein [Humibacillus xanthopallidus]